MTRILIEPTEMEAVAGDLRHTADDLSGISAGVRHDCSTCLPTQAEVIADAVIDVVNQILTLVTTDLAATAVDLLTRGATAASDSLTAASSASGLTSSPAPTVGVIGGNTFGTLTITPGELLGGSVVGGTPGFVGGGASNLIGGSFVGGQTAASAELDAFAARSPGGFLPPTFAQDALSHHNTVNLHPSRGNFMTDSGGYMSPTEYTERGFQGLNE